MQEIVNENFDELFSAYLGEETQKKDELCSSSLFKHYKGKDVSVKGKDYDNILNFIGKSQGKTAETITVFDNVDEFFDDIFAKMEKNPEDWTSMGSDSLDHLNEQLRNQALLNSNEIDAALTQSPEFRLATYVVNKISKVAPLPYVMASVTRVQHMRNVGDYSSTALYKNVAMTPEQQALNFGTKVVEMESAKGRKRSFYCLPNGNHIGVNHRFARKMIFDYYFDEKGVELKSAPKYEHALFEPILIRRCNEIPASLPFDDGGWFQRIFPLVGFVPGDGMEAALKDISFEEKKYWVLPPPPTQDAEKMSQLHKYLTCNGHAASFMPHNGLWLHVICADDAPDYSQLITFLDIQERRGVPFPLSWLDYRCDWSHLTLRNTLTGILGNYAVPVVSFADDISDGCGGIPTRFSTPQGTIRLSLPNDPVSFGSGNPNKLVQHLLLATYFEQFRFKYPKWKVCRSLFRYAFARADRPEWMYNKGYDIPIISLLPFFAQLGKDAGWSLPTRGVEMWTYTFLAYFLLVRFSENFVKRGDSYRIDVTHLVN